ncbi:type IV toxin-antitoxin system AbiEi family antitoxin [Actinoplanes sp. NPDC026619]|uniref:type IV toxin-antitoxin system AbiEi family antitoxin n=1 Tax=Actinoplanes sp. NPDC026619 TaxID=3155798 RepID=UPI0033DA4762
MQDRTPTMTRVLETVRERLREFGIALEIDQSHGDVTLSHGVTQARYALEVTEQMTLGSLAPRRSTAPAQSLLVAGEQISRRSAAAFRDAGIQFVDTLGNAYLEFGPVHIEVQGRTAPAGHPPIRGSAAPRPTNLFSSGRSQVILALLAWPELVGGKVRQIAAAAGISVGQAHDALGRLEEAGYLVPSSKALNRRDELLDFWTAAYPAGLGRRLEIARYHGDPTRPINSRSLLHVSGESAAGVDIARPATLTVYVDSLEPDLPILNRWTASPDHVPNVFVRKRFWTSPRPDESPSESTTPNAPWQLVYADLAATGDPRLAEVARTWRAHCARSGQI